MIIGIASGDFEQLKKNALQANNFWKDRNNSLDSLIPVELSEKIVIEKRMEIKEWVKEHISHDIYAVKVSRYEKVGVIEREVPLKEKQEVVKQRLFLPNKVKMEEVVIGTKKLLEDDYEHVSYWIFHFENEEEATLFKLAWV